MWAIFETVFDFFVFSGGSTGQITFDKVKPYFTVEIPEDLVTGPAQLAKMWFEVVQNGDALEGISSPLLL